MIGRANTGARRAVEADTYNESTRQGGGKIE